MKLIKKAVEIGNGAAVYIPKEYIGKDIVVLLPEGIKEIKNRVLSSLIEFMPNILGVYLYGSYARNEEKSGSDIDILVITNAKEKNDKIKEILKDIDVRVLTLESIKKSMKEYPGLIMPILKEAETLVNPRLLDELRNSEIDFKKLKWNFDDIKRIISIIEKFIEIDDKNISPLHIYSLVMRVRICYMIECLLKNKIFYNKDIERLLLHYRFKKEGIDKFFYIYSLVKENKEPKIKIEKNEILDLIKFLKEYSKKLENETKKKN